MNRTYVGLRLFRACSIADDEVEGLSNEASMTTQVVTCLHAVRDLLLGQPNKLIIEDLHGALGIINGREGPTRSTWTLALDWGDGVGCPLVDGVRSEKCVRDGAWGGD
jgi:hypothetical protein